MTGNKPSHADSPPYAFRTLTADDWKRNLAGCRSLENRVAKAIAEEIRRRREESESVKRPKV